MKTIEEIFSPLRTMMAEMMPKEVLGAEALARLADQIFDGDDPSITYSTESPMKIYSEGGRNVLAIKLPFVMEQKLELYTRKDVLTLQLGAFKKSIGLPYSLTGKPVLEADLDGSWLKIQFEGEEVGKRKGGRRRGSGKKARKTPRRDRNEGGK
jgi:arsenite-transporting ATPase